MKFQLKALVAALALVAAVPAQAAMNLAATGDSSLILTLVDSTNVVSATFDLGSTFTTFDRTVNQSWNLTTVDYIGAWTAFNAAASAGKQWGVYTADSFGGTTAGDLQRLTTAGTASGLNVSTTNSALASSGALFDQFITASNNIVDNGTSVLNNHGTVANGSNFVSLVPAATAASGLSVNAYGTTGRIANSSADTNGAFDTNLFAWTLTRSAGIGALAGVNAQLPLSPGETLRPYFNLSSTGTLTYTVASVPEPETYAMFLAGLGLMGAVARRRKSL